MAQPKFWSYLYTVRTILSNNLRHPFRALFLVAYSVLVWILTGGEALIALPLIVLLWFVFGLMP